MLRPNERRERAPYEYWAVCQACRDQFSLTLWVRPGADGRKRARVERSGDLAADGPGLRHRCGGAVQLFGEATRLLLEG